ncbi:MAG: hypothetical protein AAF216_13930 [Pseudomonadota bacterium]
MRKGTLSKWQVRMAVAITLGLFTAICFATSTSGVQVKAGALQMTMDMKPEKGLSIRFDRPVRG